MMIAILRRHHDDVAVRVAGYVLVPELMVPSKFDSMNDWTEICAAPPTWKVRMVSWGARLADRLRRDHADRLAMLTGVPRARSRP